MDILLNFSWKYLKFSRVLMEYIILMCVYLIGWYLEESSLLIKSNNRFKGRLWFLKVFCKK